jgi:type II secretory pathway pseudopilin PulG
MMNTKRQELSIANRSSARGAFTLLEISVAAAMLAVLLGTSVRVFSAMSAQQTATARQALATQTVQNALEHAETLPWDDVTAENVESIVIPASIHSTLPGATANAKIVSEEQPVRAKRVTVELSWQGPKGRTSAPSRLTTWIYPDASNEL